MSQWAVIAVALSCAASLMSLVSLAKTVMGNRREDRRRALSGPDPVCGCGHHVAFHDPAEGICHSPAQVAVEWDWTGEPSKFEERRCSCRTYAGPEPLPSYHVPELATKHATHDQSVFGGSAR
ncbi:hypothetical protein ACFWZ2_26620 [Streptomyces sp. NPDC059002]|uniref:hypothetical protein n=1 Tax=Streptomyces sp. NPDC059002 TaxID=3346690 RepID=UPI0036B88731